MTNNDGFDYQVPKKPFYRKPIGIIAIVVGVFILMGIIGSLAGGGDDDTTASDETTQSPEPSAEPKEPKSEKPEPAPEPEKPEGSLPIEDGDWRLDSVTLKNDGLGSFGGTARITYIGGDQNASNIFTITVLNKNGDVVASLDGSAEGMDPKGTETVRLISFDDWKPGKYTLFDFQKGI
jgi:hypothetical protein